MRYFKRHKLLTVILIVLSVFIYINYTSMFESVSFKKKGKYYVNSLYVSEQKIYNDYLSKYERYAYNDLINCIKKRKSTINVDLSYFDNKENKDIARYYLNASTAISLDHPELLHFGYITYAYNSNLVKIRIYYAIDNFILEEVNTLKISKIISDIKKDTDGMSDIDKIRYVYDWIGMNTRYDNTFTTMAKNQSIYNVFIRRNAVCAGFAKASQIIFQNIGIESMVAFGNSTSLHMWNIVMLDGEYYYYDSTVAASIRNKDNSHYYDGLKQSKMSEYVLNNSEWYPVVSVDDGLFD